ncbi:MAG: hypothetical protein M3310_05835 [Actinomycetota bacterium]|nr:hypothetical protein [Actinomycetota bacterium]
MVEDVRPLAEHDPKRLLLDAEEVGRQHLDARLGASASQSADRRREVSRSAVREIVAVDGRDDDVLELHLRGCVREPKRLERVGRMLRSP